MLSDKLPKTEVDMLSKRINSVLMFCCLLTAGQGLANHHDHHDHHKHETKRRNTTTTMITMTIEKVATVQTMPMFMERKRGS